MKGIIIAAGYGTRFLPCTKTIPKEMFPLIDTPAIEFIIEEFINSGISEILIVTSRRKKALEDYFDREVELESVFYKEEQWEKLEKIKCKNASFFFVRQKEMLGTGHALLICKEFIKDEPFIVAYPDDIVFSDIPLSKQLILLYEKTKGSILAVQSTEEDLSRYGVIDYEIKDDFMRIKKIVEKPPAGEAPSNIISIGRYLFLPEIVDLLEENFKRHKKGEFYHIDAINTLCKKNKVYGCKFLGERIDIGDKIGYLEGIIKYALQRQDLKEKTLNILKKYCK